MRNRDLALILRIVAGIVSGVWRLLAWALRAAARRSTSWGAMLGRTDVLVIDTETTGLDKWSEVVEVAVIDTTGCERFRALVRPTVPVEPDAARLHGLTDRRLSAALPWTEHHTEVLALLRSASAVIAYNTEFDAQMLAQTAKAHGLYWPEAGIHWRCAMRDYAAWRRVPRGDGWSWHPLWTAASREGVEARQSHRALGDARLVLALMRARPEIGAAR